MKSKRKIAVLCLVLMMIVSLLAGCNTQQKQPSGNNAQTPATQAPQSNEGGLRFPQLPNNTLKLTVNIPNFGTSPTDTLVQKEWQKRMEEYLGVKLDITWNITPWADYRSNEKILLESNDIPDVATYSWGAYVNQYGEDGIVLDILKYKDYMEYYPVFVKETFGGEAFAYNPDGTAYYFMDGFVNPENNTGAQSFTSFAYRFDILKKFNLKPATTIDEFTKLCADIKALIDSGKIDAKYVMSNQDKNYQFYRGFVGIFHTWDTLYWNGEKWSYGPIEDNFRTMLKYLNQLYKAGYIDPEFSTDDGTRCTEKAVNGNHVIVPTLWSGMAGTWNMQTNVEGLEWGLAFLPRHPDFGTPWKWGSKQEGKSLQIQMGIIISARTKYPEYVVRMIDYQYNDDMIEMMNWGIEGVTYKKTADGDHVFSDEILNASDPVQKAADYGIMSSSACRTGIPFTPLTFEAMTEQIPGEPWWNPNDGYYEGKYWIESGRIGGPESVSPYDRPPVLRLSTDESTRRAELQTNCDTYARQETLKFITGELDINNDAVWEAYVKGVKSQVPDFDATLKMLLDRSDLSSLRN